MGKKYIIKLEEPEMFDERKYYQCSQIPWWAVSENIVENLTPYTEPDLEQIRKEAYEDGYKTAKVQCNIQAEKDLREVGERHYQKGLSDAWEAARKVTQVRKYGGYGDCLEEVFGRHRVPWDVFDYSATEAIEKIRQYEQEKDRQTRIEYNFDEIKDVLETTAKECNVSLDEIAEVLRKMKEANNG